MKSDVPAPPAAPRWRSARPSPSSSSPPPRRRAPPPSRSRSRCCRAAPTSSAAGNALVRIGGVSSTKGLKVTVGGANRTNAFAKRADGTVVGFVRGLKLGRSTIIARAGNRAAQLTVTNHPRSGPIFSGPQLKPWKCQATAKDAQCNEPAKFTYVYKSTDPSKSGFQPYDPANPPSDVATTKTDNGHTRAVHRARRDRLPRPRPVPDRRAVPAGQALGRPWRRSRSSTTSC